MGLRATESQHCSLACLGEQPRLCDWALRLLKLRVPCWVKLLKAGGIYSGQVRKTSTKGPQGWLHGLVQPPDIAQKGYLSFPGHSLRLGSTGSRLSWSFVCRLIRESPWDPPPGREGRKQEWVGEKLSCCTVLREALGTP